MATFDKFIKSIRTEFGEQGAGKKFEVFCKWFLENHPEWSKTVDKVWLWDEKHQASQIKAQSWHVELPTQRS